MLHSAALRPRHRCKNVHPAPAGAVRVAADRHAVEVDDRPVGHVVGDLAIGCRECFLLKRCHAAEPSAKASRQASKTTRAYGRNRATAMLKFESLPETRIFPSGWSASPKP